MHHAGAGITYRPTEQNNETVTSTTTTTETETDDIVEAFALNDKYFAKEIQKFQALDKFARFDHE